jgi:hypothetical protein
MVSVPKPTRSPRKSRKPLKRSKLKPRGKRTRKSKGALFPHRRQYEYQEWIRACPCLLEDRWLTHSCFGHVECAHVTSRGAGGADVGNCVPLCTGAHAQQHLWGIKTFQHEWEVDLKATAAELAQRYRQETG